MNKLRVVYFGTPYFSADLLEKILNDKSLPIEIIMVVTQPDKKTGRKQTLTPSPVKLIAQKYGITIYKERSKIPTVIPSVAEESLQTKGSLHFGRDDKCYKLKELDIDLAILFAYGKIIPADILSIPKYGFWGVHPSLLPRYRGPSPMTFPLIMGDSETGVTIIKMDEEVDHGPIIAQEKFALPPNFKRPGLEKNSTEIAFNILKNVIDSGVVPTLSGTPQNDAAATFTTLLHKNDGFIPFDVVKKLVNNEEIFPEDFPKLVTEYYVRNNISLSSIQHPKSSIFFNLFRGLYPWPGIWTLVNINGQQKRLKITDVEPSFVIKKVQLEGKTEVDFKTFNEAYKIFQ